MIATSSPDRRPRAVIYRNGCQLFLPIYDRHFVQQLKRVVPPKARVFHGGLDASYTIITPWHTKAVALAGEFFADFTRQYTDEPYDYPGGDGILLLQRRKRVAR